MIDVLDYLDQLIPDAICELHFTHDYELLMAVVLSAQTTDKRVNQVTDILYRDYPTVEDLANAPISVIENIIKPIGTFRKKAVFVNKIAIALRDQYDCIVPNDRSALEKLPGVGHKTASVVLSVLFDVPAIAVDTHVSRVSKRLKLVNQHDDVSVIEQKLMKKIPIAKWGRTHHQMVLFGRHYCKAINPMCETCGLQKKCGYYKKVYSKK